ncbi:MAG: hypothetical protein ACM3NS_10020 [Deltaproteobacteria bacterium]
MRRALLLLAAAGLAAACGGGDKKGSGDQSGAAGAAKVAGGLVGGFLKMAAKQDSIDKANPYHDLHDPCILVSRVEAEKYLGPLRADPWREETKCVYDAASGRSITIDVSYTGGQMAMKMMKAVGGLTNMAIVDESGKADTLDGDWDQVRWQYGTLDALKGDVMVGVDVQASDAGPVGAAALANIALKRLPSPLAYDGEAAAAHKPGPLVAPRDPCSLVTKDEAAAILGKLEGDPKSDAMGCTFLVPSPLGHGTMPVELTVTWNGGFDKFGEQKMVNGMVEKSFTGPIMGGAGADQMDQKMNSTPTGKQEMEKMRNMVGGMGPSLKEGSLQLKTDTTVAGGPWDEAAVLSGLTFTAVKKDVYISVALQMLGEPKARALVAKAMSRI